MCMLAFLLPVHLCLTFDAAKDHSATKTKRGYAGTSAKQAVA
jgi:hypothetical protein